MSGTSKPAGLVMPEHLQNLESRIHSYVATADSHEQSHNPALQLLNEALLKFDCLRVLAPVVHPGAAPGEFVRDGRYGAVGHVDYRLAGSSSIEWYQGCPEPGTQIYIAPPSTPAKAGDGIIDLTCTQCGHVDRVYAGSIGARSCPSCKAPRPSVNSAAAPPPGDVRRVALIDAAKAMCSKCARGDDVEFQADPTPMYWHGNVECQAAAIHLVARQERRTAASASG